MTFDVTVKDASNADVTFRNIVAGSDGVPSRWDVPTSNTIRGFRSTVSLASRDSGNNSRRGRNVQLQFRFPQVNNVDGVQAVVSTTPIDIKVVLPASLTDEQAEDFVALAFNFLANAKVKNWIASGFGPTA